MQEPHVVKAGARQKHSLDARPQVQDGRNETRKKLLTKIWKNPRADFGSDAETIHMRFRCDFAT